jgi:hypothetical protein
MEKDLEAMTRWLKDSSMKVIKDKTEVCEFYRLDCPPITVLTINQIKITSVPSINRMGMEFETKLN